VKVAALAMAGSNLPELKALLGSDATLAALLFGGASASKDILVVVLDYLDDGKRNHSVRGFGLPLMLLAAVGIGLLLPSCANSNGTAVPVIVSQRAPGNVIQVQALVPVTLGATWQPALLVLPAPPAPPAAPATPVGDE